MVVVVVVVVLAAVVLAAAVVELVFVVVALVLSVLYLMVVQSVVAQQSELESVGLGVQGHHVPMDSVDLVDNIDSWIEDADTLDIHIEAQVQAHTVAHTLDSISQK